MINPQKRASDDLPRGTPINVQVTFATEGVYVLEVNTAGGEAIINSAVYVGDIYPLLPDFVDLADPVYLRKNNGTPSILSSRRFMILDMVNTVRKRYGVDAVFMDETLNNLAQNYSQTMINGNFFGHYDLQGQSPNDRAKKFGIV